MTDRSRAAGVVGTGERHDLAGQLRDSGSVSVTARFDLPIKAVDRLIALWPRMALGSVLEITCDK